MGAAALALATLGLGTAAGALPQAGSVPTVVQPATPTQGTVSGAGPAAPGTNTDAAAIVPSVEIRGTITAVDGRAGTITIRGEDGPATVVVLGTAAASYHVGQQVDVTGTPAGPGGSTTTVRAQVVTLEDTQATPDASESAAADGSEPPDSSSP